MAKSLDLVKMTTRGDGGDKETMRTGRGDPSSFRVDRPRRE